MTTSTTLPTFLPLTGFYEPSAILQLPDGRFLIAEDEKKHAFSLVTLDAGGVRKHTPLSAGWFDGGDDVWNMDDLEGLALDSRGYCYAITSHSRDEAGQTKKPRERLARFKIDKNRLGAPVVVGGLRRALVARHPVLAAAAEVAQVKSGGGLNIEALEITPDQRLLIGFRSPLQGASALIASVENVAAVFDAGAAPQVSSVLQALDLGGQGIRSLSYVAALGGYLLISGPVSREKAAFGLWFWSGQPSAPARRVSVPGGLGLAHAEGVCPAVMDGVQKIIIVSDDGNRKDGKYASFLLLDSAQLQIAS
ncbi:MAG: DUF3616 domain-containing protein [Polaromonas sp.]|nr:DUF3616 domain-containing protein [Polaromonas sp.]